LLLRRQRSLVLHQLSFRALHDQLPVLRIDLTERLPRFHGIVHLDVNVRHRAAHVSHDVDLIERLERAGGCDRHRERATTGRHPHVLLVGATARRHAQRHSQAEHDASCVRTKQRKWKSSSQCSVMQGRAGRGQPRRGRPRRVGLCCSTPRRVTWWSGRPFPA
jgi:hypothetical protein